jgi:hypothetical protein
MKQQLKTLIWLMAMAVALPVLGHAQAASAAGGADKQEMIAKMEKMSAALQLSPEQKQKMMPIVMEEGQKMKALKANTSLGPMQKAMQMKQVSADMDAKVQPILSPQQFQKFQAIQQQEREQMIEKMRSGQ